MKIPLRRRHATAKRRRWWTEALLECVDALLKFLT